MKGVESEFVFYYHFISLSHISLGLHIDVASHNIEVASLAPRESRSCRS
jgi:hypothetical protein